MYYNIVIKVNDEFSLNFQLFCNFFVYIVPKMGGELNYWPNSLFFYDWWPFPIEASQKTPKILTCHWNNPENVKDVKNPEKIPDFVKKKSHDQKNGWMKKSLCAKLQNYMKKNYTQGFCFIFKHNGVTFFFNG